MAIKLCNHVSPHSEKMIKPTFPSTVQLNQNQKSQIESAADILLKGGVVAFPTETVYGLGADATNPDAVRKIYAIKQRPSDHPLILHISDIGQLDYWALDIPESARVLAKRFWPGPLTLILKRSRHVPGCVTGGQETVGIRIPAHPVALALLKALGPNKAVAAPSANLYGKISPTSAVHVRTALADEVDMILDGGACEVGLESTIVSFGQKTVTVLRPGGIAVSDIEAALNCPVRLIQKHEPAICVSGTLPAHYAPSTPLKMLSQAELSEVVLQYVEQGFKISVITWSGMDLLLPRVSNIRHILMPPDPIQYGRQLYAVLHQCDQLGLGYILMEAPPNKPDWLAISDRLQRASHAHL